jgi:molybdopterin converting factor small subunit
VNVRLLLFATAREAAGCNRDVFELAPGTSLERLLAAAAERYGDRFAEVLSASRVWLNGDEPAGDRAAALCTELHDGDEVAVLPPVSGGATDGAIGGQLC